jgi:hypothetical protein
MTSRILQDSFKTPSRLSARKTPRLQAADLDDLKTPSSKRTNNRKTPRLQSADLDDLKDSYKHEDSQREDSKAATCGLG